MWSKRQIVEAAFNELAIASYVFDLTPEEMQAAVVKLDAQMATWAALDINVSYAFGLTPDDTSLDMDSGVPLYAIEAVFLNLAIKISASKGKPPPQSTKVSAKAAYDAMLVVVAKAQLQQQQQPSGMPRGAGAKDWRDSSTQPFFQTPDTAPLTIGSDGGLDFNGT